MSARSSRLALVVGALVSCALVYGVFLGGTAQAQAVGSPHARAWLGIGMETVGAEVHVTHVVHGSPAAGAGLQVGDRIVRVGERDVRTPREVMELVRARDPGDLLAVVYGRGGRSLNLSVALTELPSPDQILRMDRVGFQAPPWTDLEATSGAPSSLGDLRGRVVLLDFWATWCGPCRALAPALTVLQARYGAQGLSVVGVTADEAEKVADFKSQVDMRYAAVIDRKGTTSMAYGVSSLPALFVVDKRGVVREVFVGFAPGEDAQIETIVRSLLAEPTSSPASGAP